MGKKICALFLALVILVSLCGNAVAVASSDYIEEVTEENVVGTDDEAIISESLEPDEYFETEDSSIVSETLVEPSQIAFPDFDENSTEPVATSGVSETECEGETENETEHENPTSTNEKVNWDDLEIGESIEMTMSGVFPGNGSPLRSMRSGTLSGTATQIGRLTWPNVTWFSWPNGEKTKGIPLIKMNGQWSYCIQPGPDVGSSYVGHSNSWGETQTGATQWIQLSAAKQNAIRKILAYGYPNYSFPEYTANSQESGAMWYTDYQKVGATQVLIYEILCNWRNPTTFERESAVLINTISPNPHSVLDPVYNDIVSRVKKHGIIPSFADFGLTDAPEVTLTYNSLTNKYEATLVDTNNVLSQFSFNSVSGLTMTKTGNTLKLSTSNPALNGTIVSGEGMYIGLDEIDIVVWGGAGQAIISAAKSKMDPTPVYFKLKLPTATMTAMKNYDGGSKEGFCFSIYLHPNAEVPNGKLWYGKTAADGRLYVTDSNYTTVSASSRSYVFNDLKSGTYSFREALSRHGYDRAEAYSWGIAVKNASGATVSTHGPYNAGGEYLMRDTNGDATLSNINLVIPEGGRVEMVIENRDFRGAFEFNKVNSEGIAMGNILFELAHISEIDGSVLEKHIVATSASGYFSTERNWHSTPANVNKLDEFINRGKTESDRITLTEADKEKIRTNEVWFGSGTPLGGYGALPSGKYVLTELYTNTNEGRVIAAPLTIYIDQKASNQVNNGTVTHPGIKTLPDIVNKSIRASMTFTKVDARGDGMAQVPFLLELLDANNNTIEAHVLLTRTNGQYSTETPSHTAGTNQNDTGIISYSGNNLVLLKGTADNPIDVAAMGLSNSRGIWFYGNRQNNGLVLANSYTTALVPGTYRLSELRATTNVGKQMITPILFTVSSQYASSYGLASPVALGTITNGPINAPMTMNKVSTYGNKENYSYNIYREPDSNGAAQLWYGKSASDGRIYVTDSSHTTVSPQSRTYTFTNMKTGKYYFRELLSEYGAGHVELKSWRIKVIASNDSVIYDRTYIPGDGYLAKDSAGDYVLKDYANDCGISLTLFENCRIEMEIENEPITTSLTMQKTTTIGTVDGFRFKFYHHAGTSTTDPYAAAYYYWGVSDANGNIVITDRSLSDKPNANVNYTITPNTPVTITDFLPGEYTMTEQLSISGKDPRIYTKNWTVRVVNSQGATVGTAQTFTPVIDVNGDYKISVTIPESAIQNGNHVIMTINNDYNSTNPPVMSLGKTTDYGTVGGYYFKMVDEDHGNEQFMRSDITTGTLYTFPVTYITANRPDTYIALNARSNGQSEITLQPNGTYSFYEFDYTGQRFADMVCTKVTITVKNSSNVVTQIITRSGSQIHYDPQYVISGSRSFPTYYVENIPINNLQDGYRVFVEFHNEHKRGSMSFTKINVVGGGMGRVPFLLERLDPTGNTNEAIESHIIVTQSARTAVRPYIDAGYFSTEAYGAGRYILCQHSTTTNSNDSFMGHGLTPNDRIDANSLSLTSGVWFGTATVSDADMALPIGSYRLTELYATSNVGKAMIMPIEFTVVAGQNTVIGDAFGEIMNEEARGGLEFRKTDGSGNPMAHVPFLLERLDANANPVEAHVLLTDSTGYYSTEQYSHRTRTNYNDDGVVYMVNGVPTVVWGTAVDSPIDVGQVQMNEANGVWFKGIANDPPTDARKALPLGNYRLTELYSDTNEGKLLVAPRYFTITEDNTFVDFDLGTFINTVDYGGKLKITKWSEDGNAANIEFTVEELVGGPDSDVLSQSDGGFYYVGTTNDDGIIVIGGLVAGRYYRITETVLDKYTVSGGTSASQVIRIAPDAANTPADETRNVVSFRNYLLRGSMEFQKNDEYGTGLSNIPFLLTNTETNEAHVIFTNANGYYSTEEYFHTITTNREDWLVEDYGGTVESPIDEGGYGFGTWFFGTADETIWDATSVSNAKKALPYGTYTLRELVCENNMDVLLLPEITFEISEDTPTHHINLGELVNYETRDIKITKVVSGTNVPLPNVEFQLLFSLDDGDTWFPIVYREDTAEVVVGTTTSEVTEDGKLLTDESGYAVFSGLAANGEILYRLVETKTAEGFMLLSCEAYEGYLTEFEKNEDLNLTVANSETFKLPMTGGKRINGAIIALYALCGVTALLGGYVLIGKKKSPLC